MKIVVVSDTHGKHAELGMLSGDVLIHCGDFSVGAKNEADALRDLDEWFACQNFKPLARERTVQGRPPGPRSAAVA